MNTEAIKGTFKEIYKRIRKLGNRLERVEKDVREIESYGITYVTQVNFDKVYQELDTRIDKLNNLFTPENKRVLDLLHVSFDRYGISLEPKPTKEPEKKEYECTDKDGGPSCGDYFFRDGVARCCGTLVCPANIILRPKKEVIRKCGIVENEECICKGRFVKGFRTCAPHQNDMQLANKCKYLVEETV